jgi:hypothetical protein
MAAETKLEPFNVNVSIKISALWTSMLFVFAYVDLFSLYRRDFRADLEAATEDQQPVEALADRRGELLRPGEAADHADLESDRQGEQLGDAGDRVQEHRARVGLGERSQLGLDAEEPVEPEGVPAP